MVTIANNILEVRIWKVAERVNLKSFPKKEKQFVTMWSHGYKLNLIVMILL